MPLCLKCDLSIKLLCSAFPYYVSHMIFLSLLLGVIFDGVILEGAFNSARQKIPGHAFAWVISPIFNIWSALIAAAP